MGARFADLEGSDEGSAYVFERSGDTWTEVANLPAPEPSDGDPFGVSVAIAGGIEGAEGVASDAAIVGTPSDNSVGMTEETITGTATLFREVR